MDLQSFQNRITAKTSFLNKLFTSVGDERKKTFDELIGCRFFYERRPVVTKKKIDQ